MIPLNVNFAACWRAIPVWRHAKWVRPLLRLAESRGVRVNFGRLLDDLLYFDFGPRVKERWAMDFYGRKEEQR